MADDAVKLANIKGLWKVSQLTVDDEGVVFRGVAATGSCVIEPQEKACDSGAWSLPNSRAGSRDGLTLNRSPMPVGRSSDHSNEFNIKVRFTCIVRCCRRRGQPVVVLFTEIFHPLSADRVGVSRASRPRR